MDKLQPLKEQIDRLSALELEEITTHLAYRSSQAELKALSSREHLMWVGMLAALPEPRPKEALIGSFLKTFGRNKFIEASIHVHAFIDSGLGDQIIRRPEKLILITICFEGLRDFLDEIGAPSSPQTLLNNIHHLAHAVDKAFPGYAQGQKLHWLLRFHK